MSITAIFTRSQPNIGGFAFDALLEETTELQADVTQFPIETGAIGFDHAVIRPERITMTVALSDNPIRALMASQGALAGAGAGALVGYGLSRLPSTIVALAGVGARLVGAGSGGAMTRSASALGAIRDIQRARQFITVVGAKKIYQNVLITNTRQTTNKENEQGLELSVEMRVFELVYSASNQGIVSGSLPENDTSATQAQPWINSGPRRVQ